VLLFFCIIKSAPSKGNKKLTYSMIAVLDLINSVPAFEGCRGDTAEVDESLIGIGNKRRTSPETWQMSD
jgi:hypothetical protein